MTLWQTCLYSACLPPVYRPCIQFWRLPCAMFGVIPLSALLSYGAMVSLPWDVVRRCVGTAVRRTPPCVPSLCTVLHVSYTNHRKSN
jgi:hypothetical protein